MPQLPEFITFTGVDDRTPIDGMLKLARLYPIEWGVLMSPKRQGIEPRYPSWSTIQRLTRHSDTLRLRPGLRLAAHLCGGYAREVNESGCVRGVDAMLGNWFSRAQINSDEPCVYRVQQWARRVGVEAICQHRNYLNAPLDDRVQWLFDASGGRGIAPRSWPLSTEPDLLTGYAGGLTPDNVGDAVARIGSGPARYWIDMETGVRDEDDCFSLDRCRAVCEAVYGRSLFA